MEHPENCMCHMCLEPRVEAARPTDDQRAKWLGDALTEGERLRRELREARDTNDFDAKRLRRLALLLGLSVPESDETLLGCAGTVLGQACRAVEQLFGKAESDGRCSEGDRCVCGGDTPGVRAGCSNWIAPNSSDRPNRP